MSIKRELGLGQLSITCEFRLGQLSITRELGLGQLSIIRKLGLGQLSITRELGLGQLSIIRKLGLGQLSITRRLKLGQLSINLTLFSLVLEMCNSSQCQHESAGRKALKSALQKTIDLMKVDWEQKTVSSCVESYKSGLPGQPRKFWYCGVCGLLFKSITLLLLHLPKHLRNRSWDCHVCLSLFLEGLDLLAMIPGSYIADAEGNKRSGKKIKLNPKKLNWDILCRHWNAMHAVEKLGEDGEEVGNDADRGWPTMEEMRDGKPELTAAQNKKNRKIYEKMSQGTELPCQVKRKNGEQVEFDYDFIQNLSMILNSNKDQFEHDTFEIEEIIDVRPKNCVDPALATNYKVRWSWLKNGKQVTDWQMAKQFKKVGKKEILVESDFMCTGAAYPVSDYWAKRGIAFDHIGLHYTEQNWFKTGNSKRPALKAIK